jgi:hypothetical protein
VHTAFGEVFGNHYDKSLEVAGPAASPNFGLGEIDPGADLTVARSPTRPTSPT